MQQGLDGSTEWTSRKLVVRFRPSKEYHFPLAGYRSRDTQRCRYDYKGASRLRLEELPISPNFDLCLSAFPIYNVRPYLRRYHHWLRPFRDLPKRTMPDSTQRFHFPPLPLLLGRG